MATRTWSDFLATTGGLYDIKVDTSGTEPQVCTDGFDYTKLERRTLDSLDCGITRIFINNAIQHGKPPSPLAGRHGRTCTSCQTYMAGAQNAN